MTTPSVPTTPPRPVDVEAVFPELGAHTATAIRLHPRVGDPGVDDSSIGGPLRWPADEPWPFCTGYEHDVVDPDTEALAEEPVALVPVAQLYRRDVPEFAGPPDSDLVQVLWCPLDHPDTGYNPRVEVRWRRVEEIEGQSDAAPEPAVVNEDYLPTPCVVHPEPVREYQYRGALPKELQERIGAWEDESGNRYQYDLSIAPGWKVGGFASWSLSDWQPMDCEVCGTAMTLLLTAASSEGDGADNTWRTVGSSANPVDVTIGRGYSLHVFVCPASFDHPADTAMQ